MPPPLAPVARQRLADDLAQRIQQLIQAGTFQTGDRLPAIATMARQFGVGSPTLREALRTLQTVGVVDIRHGSGTYVTGAADALVISNPIHERQVSKALLLDLIAARLPIEELSARLAATHASADDLAEMRRLLARAGAALGDEHTDGDDALLNETNLAFHRQIAVASGNTVVQHILTALASVFKDAQRQIIDIQNSRRVDHAEHVTILEALEQRDPELAATRMRLHLEGVSAALRAWDPSRVPLWGVAMAEPTRTDEVVE